MEKDKDALAIIAEAYEKMKEEGCATYRGGKPNLAELSRRTGYGRKVVARLYSNGFKERPHGNSGSKGSHVINPSLEEEAKRLLASGVSNSSVVFSRLREKGYEGGLTTVKGFIRANRCIAIDIRGASFRGQHRTVYKLNFNSMPQITGLN